MIDLSQQLKLNKSGTFEGGGICHVKITQTFGKKAGGFLVISSTFRKNSIRFW